jgi:hypothetical protein
LIPFRNWLELRAGHLPEWRKRDGGVNKEIRSAQTIKKKEDSVVRRGNRGGGILFLNGTAKIHKLISKIGCSECLTEW